MTSPAQIARTASRRSRMHANRLWAWRRLGREVLFFEFDERLSGAVRIEDLEFAKNFSHLTPR